MTRARSAGDSALPDGMVRRIALETTITIAPDPKLFGAANAWFLGMTPELANRTLADMADDPAHRGRIVWLSKRPRELAADPADVLRYLRARRGAATSEAAPVDAPADGADQVLSELGLAPAPRRRRGAK